MPEEERYIALAACKFVDEVIRDAPYDLTQEWVDTLIRDHGIDYVVHGDDPCFTADGKDAYAYAKSIGRCVRACYRALACPSTLLSCYSSGLHTHADNCAPLTMRILRADVRRYRQFKRTEGVSTTDIVGRMLLMTREHHVPAPPLADRPPLGVVASATSGGAAAGGAAAAVSSAAAHRRRSSSSLRSSALAADRESDSSSPSSDSSPAGGASSSSASRALACLPAAASSRFLPTARRIMQVRLQRGGGGEDRTLTGVDCCCCLGPCSSRRAACRALTSASSIFAAGSTSSMLATSRRCRLALAGTQIVGR